MTIHKLELLEKCGPADYRLRVVCSKGTYIRTLCDDIGRALSCGGAMAALRRTRTGGFSIKDASTLDELRVGGIAARLLPPDRAMAGFHGITVTAAQAKRFCNGGQLALERLHFDGDNPVSGALYRVYGPDKTFLGMGRVDGDKGELAVQCLILE